MINNSDINKKIDKIQDLINTLATDKPLGLILGDDFITSLDEWNKTVTKRRTEPFTLMILGDFKRGKSTVINAMLGQYAASVNAAPETFAVNLIEYGEIPSVRAVLGDGNNDDIKKIDLISPISLVSDKEPLSEKDLSRENLESKTKDLKENLEYIEILNNAEFLKEVRIIDTPGLSDLNKFDKQIKHYLIKADAVIYVASALSPLSETEKAFLTEYINPQGFSKLFVLVNMIDAMPTVEDIDKVVDRISERCEDIMPGVHVYGVSALDEYNRKNGIPVENAFRHLYESEFSNFEATLKEEIIMQKESIRNARVTSMLGLMVNDTVSKIKSLYEIIDLDVKELEDFSDNLNSECDALYKALEKHKPKLNLLKTELYQQASYWMYDFFAKLRLEILECEDVDLEDLEKYFYLFLVEKIGEAYKVCLTYHREIVVEHVKTVGQAISDKLSLSWNLDNSDKDNQKPNKQLSSVVLMDLDLITIKSSGEFPQDAMPYINNIIKRKSKTDVIVATLENFDDIRNATIKNLEDYYADMEKTASEYLDEIYKTRVNYIEGVVGQAKEISGNSNSALVKKHLTNAVKIIERCGKILMEMEH